MGDRYTSDLDNVCLVADCLGEVFGPVDGVGTVDVRLESSVLP